MSGVDPTPAAVAARLSRALALGAGAERTRAEKGVRPGGEAVRDRLRRVAELRRLGLRLARGHRKDRP